MWPPPAPSRAVGGPRLPVLSRAPRRRPAPRTVSTGDPRHEAPRSLLPPRRGREVPPCTLTHWHTGSDSRVIRIRTAYHQPDFPGLAGGVPPQEGASVPQPAGTYNLVSPSPAPPPSRASRHPFRGPLHRSRLPVFPQCGVWTRRVAAASLTSAMVSVRCCGRPFLARPSPRRGS